MRLSTLNQCLALLAIIEPLVSGALIPGSLVDVKLFCDGKPCDAPPAPLPYFRFPGRAVRSLLRERAPIPPPIKGPGGKVPGKGETIPGERGSGGAPPPGEKPPIGAPGGDAPKKFGPYDMRAVPEEEPRLGWDGYNQKGKDGRKRVDDAISEKKPDVVRPDLQKLYKRTVRKEELETAWYPPGLKEIINSDKYANTFTEIEVINEISKFKPGAPVKLKMISQSSYSKEARTIDSRHSYAAEDRLPNGVRLPWSEIHYQNYYFVTGGDVKSLQFITRSNIANTKTLGVIRDARQKLNVKEDDQFAFHPDKPGTPMDEAFTTLSGSPNVRGINHMLADHHEAFGNLKIIKIYTWNHLKYPFMLVELGH